MNPYLIEGPALISFSGGRTSGYCAVPTQYQCGYCAGFGSDPLAGEANDA